MIIKIRIKDIVLNRLVVILGCLSNIITINGSMVYSYSSGGFLQKIHIGPEVLLHFSQHRA